MRFRKHPNGTMWVPERGAPPSDEDIPEGYERIPSNAYMFRPILPDCEHREHQVKDTKCCKESYRMVCHVVDSKIVTRAICAECQGDPKWILEYRVKYGL